MKNLNSKAFRIIPAALGLVVCLLASHARAAVTTWDPQLANAQNPYLGSLTGTWDNSSWDSANETGTATGHLWVENTAALFAVHSGTGTPAFTVTMTGNHTVAGIFDGSLTPNPCPVTINGPGTFILGPNNLDGFDPTTDGSDPGSIVMNAVVAGGANAVWTSEGSGQEYLYGVNTFSGGTTLGYSGSSFSGIMNFNNSASFGTGFLVISNTSSLICALENNAGAAVTIPNPVFVGKFSLQPQCNIVSAPAPNNVTFSGTWTLNGANAVIGAAIGSTYLVNISGPIVNGGSAGGVQTFNPGIIELSGANTFTGNIVMGTGAALTPGTLEIGGSGTLGNTGTGVGSYAGTIFLTNNPPANTLPGTFLYASSASQTLSGVISGGGLLTQTAGTLALTAVNTYSGQTTVSGGELLVNSPGSLAAGSAVTVKSAATLGGSGTINGSVTVQSGGVLAPGAGSSSAGTTLTLPGTVSLQAGCIVSNQINKAAGPVYTADKVNKSSGTLMLGGTLNVALDSGSVALANGDSFTLFGGTVAGSFASFNLPTLPAGLTWITSQLGVNGKLSVSCDGSLAANASGATAICPGGSATLTATPSGGSGTYASYLWNDPSSATTASVSVSPITTTTYTVTVTDSFGCTANGSVTVTVNPQPTAVVSGSASICPGCSATISAALTGTGPWNVTWSDSVVQSGVATSPATRTVNPSTTTTYTVTALNDANCTASGGGLTGSAVVTVASVAPSISAQPGNTTVCSGSPASFSVTAAGSSLSYYWTINNNSGWGNTWAVSGSGSTWLGTSTDNDQFNPDCNSFSANGDINSPLYGNALGMWGGTLGDTVAIRTFPALASGQTVSIDFDNGNVDGGSKVGFSLQTAAGADVLQFYFQGGQADYTYQDDVNGAQNSGIGWGYVGNRVQFALTCANTYVLTVTPCGGSPVTLTGTYSGATIAQVKLFNGNTAGGDEDNIYFNNLIVGGYTDNADNYNTDGGWAGYDQGNQPIGSANASSYTTPPLSAGAQYQAVVAGCGGAVLSTVASVTVNPLPTVSVNSETICAGASAVLTATTSASTPSYLWSPGGATTASITVSPASTTVYTVTVTDGVTSCANSGSGTVTVNPLPTVSVNSAAICPSGSATLTATTSASTPSYLWNDPTSATTASITVSPASTTVYTVTVTDGATGCANSGSGTVTVNPLPTVSVNSASVCAGASAVLTATTSASTPSYLWSPGGATTASITVSPASTATYTVTVTDGVTSCANSGSGTVTVIPLPAVSVNSASVCAGASAVLTATTSASTPSYHWSPGGATTASITVSPASTTVYTVTVTDGVTGCANSGSGTVTVIPLPTVSVNSASVCAGASAVLTATTSASTPSYLWSPGGATTASITVSPASTTVYTVTVTDGVTGCAKNGSGTVTVNPLPTVSVNSASVCAGASAVLTATTSASTPSYLWSPGGATTASITVSPASTTVYTVTVTDGVTSCVNSGSGTVTIIPLPTVSVNSASVCAGASAVLTATTSASTPSYLWSPGGATTASITVSPASTTTYTVTVTDGVTGCANSGSGTVTIKALPTVSVNSAAICPSGSATLTATTSAGTPSYLWSPGGATTASITVSPASTTTYTVTVTDGVTGCANSGSGTVTLNSAPTAAAGSAQTICSGSTVAIGGSPTGSGGTGTLTYLWSPATGLDDATAANPNATVTSTTTYTVTVTDANGCTATASVVVTIIPEPEITSIIQSGTDVQLVWTAVSGVTYQVQYTTTLVDYPPGPTWTTLTPNVTASGATATYTDTSATDPQRFYQISVVCP